jgi:hypothetical protein
LMKNLSSWFLFFSLIFLLLILYIN